MSSVRAHKGRLFFDFRHRGVRCREYTAMEDTPQNRKRLNAVMARIEREITEGTFDYGRYFPNSRVAARFADPTTSKPVAAAVRDALDATPRFKDFAQTWFDEQQVGWRRTYRRSVRDILDKHLLPQFGESGVGRISKADVLQFRSALAKVPGRKADSTLSPARINTIMMILRGILIEAADRYDFTTAFRGIRPLKVPRSDVDPFTLEEVGLILGKVRADFKPYYTVRFFTGMRTGEIDGLKWKFVDFERRLILVRETVVAGEPDTTKTVGSQRDIQMSQVVYDALKTQHASTGKLSEYVFCTRSGEPLEHNNVTKRVWYPLLKLLGLAKRTPYQSRHTAATLWLAAGENPEWIARQLGHTTTEMLFKVYSRYVPNLTRKDGSAFERLLVPMFGLPDAGADQSRPEARHE